YPTNIIYALIVAGVSFIAAFIFTWLSYKEETEDNGNSIKLNNHSVLAPIKGKVIPLEQVKDATFADKLLGDGIAIEPSEGKVYSPVNGTVQVMYKTGHAIGLLSDSGDEILIHIGLDTVKLEGKGFEKIAKQGEHVKAGQLLLKFDMPFIKNQGYDLTTPIVVTNLDSTGKKIVENNKSQEIGSSMPIFDIQGGN